MALHLRPRDPAVSAFPSIAISDGSPAARLSSFASVPPGFLYVPALVSPAEERALMAWLASSSDWKAIVITESDRRGRVIADERREQAPRPQDTKCLGEGALGIGHVTEHGIEHDDVERPVVERKRLAISRRPTAATAGHARDPRRERGRRRSSSDPPTNRAGSFRTGARQRLSRDERLLRPSFRTLRKEPSSPVVALVGTGAVGREMLATRERAPPSGAAVDPVVS